MSTIKKSKIHRLAREIFGFRRLRPEQEEAILSILEDHDTLAVMPTGAGKSAIYQLAALEIPGPTVIVSPLIALQRDQVQALAEIDAGGAAMLNSALNETEHIAEADLQHIDDNLFLLAGDLSLSSFEDELSSVLYVWTVRSGPSGSSPPSGGLCKEQQ